MIESNTAEAARDNGEWIRPSPAREKAWRIATWIIFIFASILFVGCGIWFCFLTDGERASPKLAVLFLIPVGLWFLVRAKEKPPIYGVRIADGSALQVKMDDGWIVTITYEKLANMTQYAKVQFVRLRENGRYSSPRTDGYYVGWARFGPQLSHHDIGRLGVSNQHYFNDG